MEIYRPNNFGMMFIINFWGFEALPSPITFQTFSIFFFFFKWDCVVDSEATNSSLLFLNNLRKVIKFLLWGRERCHLPMQF